MTFTDRLLRQTIVHWANPVPDGQGGHSYDSPVEIDGRWEDKNEKFTSATGQELVSRSVVFVDRDISPDEYLYLGELADFDSSEAEVPENIDWAYIVKAFSKVPNIRGNVFERKVWL